MKQVNEQDYARLVVADEVARELVRLRDGSLTLHIPNSLTVLIERYQAMTTATASAFNADNRRG